MLRLGLVRHAKSSWDYPDLNDHDRPLNKRGKRDAPIMAAKAQKLFGVPDLLLSSTALRAYTTAKTFQEEMSLKESQLEKNGDLYHASIEDVMNCISMIDDKVSFALIFGHNPTTTYFANSFNGDMIDNVPTCGLIMLESTASSWMELEPTNTKRVAFIYPKLYV